jgi:hypothetical protein
VIPAWGAMMSAQQRQKANDVPKTAIKSDRGLPKKE